MSTLQNVGLLQRHNPDSHAGNALVLAADTMQDKGEAAVVARDYTCTIADVSALTTSLASITIGGTVYAFDTPVPVGDAALEAKLHAEIEGAYEAFKTAQAAATPKVAVVNMGGLSVTQTGNQVVVKQLRSHFVLNSIEDGAGSAVSTAFTAVDSPK